ncbi:MAG TPA: DNA polymerase III subunit gamma/tau [Candidatus Babeliales bacterium]|nr:DNA polymerase III subunit gamma/tau [Candidatus Babeliales bacterium]
MTTAHLNLARKWRSKNFDQIVGQDLSVKMLKNSLYLGSYFPVYLFSGQRGCGKTSLARIFACALNCSRLSDFQKEPTKRAIPCLSCDSCMAMMASSHPDFFEIDAASHTGVDTIRTIIDASNLLPLLGTKKIYLIDEAHMLSKASFNALLKILEEPPCAVLFILATTDPEKIIETVRSRCFQLFFKPIDGLLLVNHLAAICEQERIAFDHSGLQLIIDETEGSARDAINLLEQVRFAAGVVNKSAVLMVLGHVGDEQMVALLDIVLHKSPKELLSFLKEVNMASYSIEFVWKKFFALIRAALWLKHGVAPDEYKNQFSAIQQIIGRCSLQRLHQVLELLCANELVFGKTTAKYALFEIILLQLCQKNSLVDDTSGSLSGTPTVALQTVHEPVSDIAQDEHAPDEDDSQREEDYASKWDECIVRMQTLSDPLLLSIFQQGVCIAFDYQTSQLTVAFPKDFVFFKDKLDEGAHLWQPLVAAAFNGAVTIQTLFILEGKSGGTRQINQGAALATDTNVNKTPSIGARVNNFVNNKSPVSNVKHGQASFDISDAAVWKKTTMLLNHFPGMVTEIRG